ncbi:MAG: hypothetical protein ACK4JE_06175, partial [Endomicrobiia bacterium]
MEKRVKLKHYHIKKPRNSLNKYNSLHLLITKLVCICYLIFLTGCANKFVKNKSDEKILFKIEIQGGIMGVNREILIKENGEALFVDKKEKERKLFNISEQELKEFNELFHKINSKIVGEPFPDCFIYK